MSSIFNTPAYAPATQATFGTSSGEGRVPASQAIQSGGNPTSAAPNGAGAPVATGAVADPTGQNPAPAPTPPVSVSQLGTVAAAAINGQEPPEESGTGTPQSREWDPVAEAVQGYRNAAETTNGAEPGTLMIAA